MYHLKTLGVQDQTKWLVFRVIHEKDSLLPMDKVWSLDFLGRCNLFPIYSSPDLFCPFCEKHIHMFHFVFHLCQVQDCWSAFRLCSAKESRLGPGKCPKIGHSEGAKTPHQNERWYPKTSVGIPKRNMNDSWLISQQFLMKSMKYLMYL